MPDRFKTISSADLLPLAKNINGFFAKLHPRNRAALIFLSGELGSGKTTFVKALARSFRVRARVHSPTFVFVHEHPIKKIGAQFSKLIHVDAYRMDSRRDVSQTGLREYIKDPQNIVVIEWGEKIAPWIPKPDITIEFRHHTPTLREIKIKKRLS